MVIIQPEKGDSGREIAYCRAGRTQLKHKWIPEVQNQQYLLRTRTGAGQLLKFPRTLLETTEGRGSRGGKKVTDPPWWCQVEEWLSVISCPAVANLLWRGGKARPAHTSTHTNPADIMGARGEVWHSALVPSPQEFQQIGRLSRGVSEDTIHIIFCVNGAPWREYNMDVVLWKWVVYQPCRKKCPY